MISGLDPDEKVKAQYHIGASLCETFKECGDLTGEETVALMEHLYEYSPFTSKRIADEIFDMMGNRHRINRVTPTTIGKKYMPLLDKYGVLEMNTTSKGTTYKLNGYKKLFFP